MKAGPPIGCALAALAAFALACSDPAPPELPTMGTPPTELRWPPAPADMPGDVRRCVDDYRALGRGGLPPIPSETAFATWYRGAFQAWTERYNATRARCDDVFQAMDQASRSAQVLLAAQSFMHERLGRDAAPLDEEPQMFIMSTYWKLGAACTYQSCREGPDRAYTDLCAERAGRLPPCPPVDEPAD